MRRMVLLLGAMLVTAVALFPVSTAAAPSEKACNQGTMNAHAKIPHDAPAHAHVPHCDH